MIINPNAPVVQQDLVESRREIAALKSDVKLLKEQVKFLDTQVVALQQYVNELLKRAGIKGGFAG